MYKKTVTWLLPWLHWQHTKFNKFFKINAFPPHIWKNLSKVWTWRLQWHFEKFHSYGFSFNSSFFFFFFATYSLFLWNVSLLECFFLYLRPTSLLGCNLDVDQMPSTLNNLLIFLLFFTTFKMCIRKPSVALLTHATTM